MAEVILEHVWKIYDGKVAAVKDVNLEIKDREFMVLVGPSGCGKSTTLRMIAGLEEISKGEIRIGDRVVNNVAPKDRDIAMVFQNYALYPHMTVYDNMAFGLKLRNFSKEDIQARVMEAARILGPLFARAFIVPAPSYRAMDVKKISAAFMQTCADVRVFADIPAAMEAARDKTVAACGSFTLLKEVKQWIEQRR